MLSIGALARATGISIDTLRTWERRYGYPVPDRKPSGHRVYPLSSVPRLQRVAVALARGHRAGEVVPASDAELAELIRTPLAPAVSGPGGAREPVRTADILEAVEHFDGQQLTRLLTAEWGSLGPLAFVRTLVAPLLRAVGDAWADGRLEIRHEHFVTERIGDVLRAFRLPFEERARGPLVVFGTLPGEVHGLGLQMAALILAPLGCRVCYLGTDVPLEQLASLAKDLGARAVAVSVSAASRGARATADLTRLRELLPRRVTVLVGGEGAPMRCTGVELVQDLGLLHAWGTRLMQSAT
jgi:DNA-binding transcriptional MerR regulator/methylmalonyl-CoA mutase cobalamin-binding subunit